MYESRLGLERTTQTISHHYLVYTQTLSIAVDINGYLGCACRPQVMGDPQFYLVSHSILGYLCLLGVLSYKGPRICFPVIFVPKFPFIWALSILYLLLFRVADFQVFNEFFIIFSLNNFLKD